MGFVAAADPASKTAYVFTNVNQLSSAIKSYGFLPLAPDGSQFKVQEFEGGYLLGGAPINVWMGFGWYAGQRELLEPYWASGQIPTPPAEVLNAPVYEMPEDVAAEYNAYKAAQAGGGIFGSNLGLGVAAVAIGAALWFMLPSASSGRGGSREADY